MNKKQLKLSRKTRKDMVNALLKHDPAELFLVTMLGWPTPLLNRRTATNRVAILAWQLSENISRKNPRRRGVITLTIVKRWKEETQWAMVYCGQGKKTKLITHVYPEGTCDERPGEVHVRY